MSIKAVFLILIVSVLSLSCRDSEDKKQINTELERQTLVLDLKGRFLRVGKFLDNYEKINAPLKLQSCDISLDTLDPIGVTAQLRFVMYTGIKS